MDLQDGTEQLRVRRDAQCGQPPDARAYRVRRLERRTDAGQRRVPRGPRLCRPRRVRFLVRSARRRGCVEGAPLNAPRPACPPRSHDRDPRPELVGQLPARDVAGRDANQEGRARLRRSAGPAVRHTEVCTAPGRSDDARADRGTQAGQDPQNQEAHREADRRGDARGYTSRRTRDPLQRHHLPGLGADTQRAAEPPGRSRVRGSGVRHRVCGGHRRSHSRTVSPRRSPEDRRGQDPQIAWARGHQGRGQQARLYPGIRGWYDRPVYQRPGGDLVAEGRRLVRQDSGRCQGQPGHRPQPQDRVR